MTRGVAAARIAILIAVVSGCLARPQTTLSGANGNNAKLALAALVSSVERRPEGAALMLGQLLEHGIGTARNDAAAEPWLQLAAARGSSTAAADLGAIEATRGDPEGRKRAEDWYMIAALEGDWNARGELRKLLVADTGPPANAAASVQSVDATNAPPSAHDNLTDLVLRARAHDATALLQLGHMAEAGSRLTRSPVAAYQFYWLAATAGSMDGAAAAVRLATMLPTTTLRQATDEAARIWARSGYSSRR